MNIDHEWNSKPFAPTNPTYNRIGSKRRFGVELEYQDLPGNYIDLEDYSVFGAKDDPSVEGGEFDSPVLYGDQGLDECTKFCDFTRDHGFEVGQGAGFHLHVDLTDEPVNKIKRLALAYHYTMNLWYNMCDPCRRDYTYCQRHRYNRQRVLDVKEHEGFNTFIRSVDRYEWLNWKAYWYHKTFEIRCHETTDDSRDVCSWVTAHTCFADAMLDMGIGKITRVFARKTDKEMFRELRHILRNPDVSGHLSSRYRRFNHESLN